MVDFLIIPDLFENVLQGGGIGKLLQLRKKILMVSFHVGMFLQQVPDFFSFFCSRDLYSRISKAARPKSACFRESCWMARSKHFTVEFAA
jgi:hypothetical protein